MSEQSTRIADQRSGDRIATRDAIENDENGDPRTIQILDFASRQVALLDWQIVRGGGYTFITSADVVTLGSLPADLKNNKIQVGDHSILCVMPYFKSNDGSATITPLHLSSGDICSVVRAAKTSAMGTAKFSANTSWQNPTYYGPMLSWDVLGAEYIGLHVTAVSGSLPGVALVGALI